jgi:hypothetical protein
MILSQQVAQYLEFGVRTSAEDFLSNVRFRGVIQKRGAQPTLNE